MSSAVQNCKINVQRNALYILSDASKTALIKPVKNRLHNVELHKHSS